jgi:hypothetical protein
MLNAPSSFRQLERLVRHSIWLRPILVLEKLSYLILHTKITTMFFRIMTDAALALSFLSPLVRLVPAVFGFCIGGISARG